MNHIAKVVASALVFGCVAGASMVGVNVAAQNSGLVKTQQESSVESTTAAAESSSAAETAAAAETTASAASTGSGKTVTQVAQDAMPSVVAITNMIKYQQNGYSLFGSYETQETEVPASGSGVIIGKTDSELLIVTNNHVVEDSSSLSVTFVDNKTVDAQIKGTDSTVDLAIVSVKLSDIPADTLSAIKVATLGNSDSLQVGDQVVAIGNAMGYGQSVTTGIISAKDRDIQTSDSTEEGLLQTDAAINPGNSGGALLNMDGEVIGINVAKYSSTDVEGMGYSIPSSKAQDVIDSLSTLATRDDVPEAERGVLGIQVKNIDQQTAQSFGMPQGVFVYKLTEGSTAKNSELQEKDIITKLDGQGISNYDDLKTILSKYRAGETVSVTVQRQNGSGVYEEKVVSVTLGASDTASSGSTQSGQDQSGNANGSQNDQNDQNGQNGQSGSQNGQDSQNGQNGQNGNQDYGQLWEQFQEFFNQYQR